MSFREKVKAERKRQEDSFKASIPGALAEVAGAALFLVGMVIVCAVM